MGNGEHFVYQLFATQGTLAHFPHWFDKTGDAFGFMAAYYSNHNARDFVNLM